MPRFAEHEPIYRAFNQFAERCVLDNRSLLWPEREIWTQNNIEEITQRIFYETILGSNYSFTQKLQLKLKGAPQEQWMLLADTYFVYYLTSSSIRPENKQAGIRWVVEQAGVDMPHIDNALWAAQAHGFTHTGQRYHLKYMQMWLILSFANYFKTHTMHPMIFSNSQSIKNLLDDLLENVPKGTDKAYDMRHAILYMLMPAYYEPIISTKDKQDIVQAYGKRLIGTLPTDMDQAILTIREALSKTLPQSDLPFKFHGAMKSEWKPEGKSSRQSATVEISDEDENLDKKIIFISYRRDDSGDVTGRIYDWLVNSFSEEQVFKDVDSIPLGVNFKHVLNDQVSKCDVLLAVIGDKWLSIADAQGQRRIDHPSDYVRIEIEAALTRGIPVIPVLVQGAYTPQENVLPVTLKELAYMNGTLVRRDPDFKNDMMRLITALKAILSKKQSD